MAVFWILLLLVCKQYLATHHDVDTRWPMMIDAPIQDDVLKNDELTYINEDELSSLNNQLYSSEEQLGASSSRLKDSLIDKLPHLSENDHTRDNGFIRFGRNDGALMKTGFIRFGRSGPKIMRVIRDDPELIRFGRRGDQFIRLGRNSAEDLSSVSHKQPKEHQMSTANNPSDQLDSRSSNYIRFGRRDDGFVRLGKKSTLV